MTPRARSARRPSPCLAAPLLALAAASCGPGVSLSRVVPAPVNLGPVKTLALVDARGPDREVERFVGSLLYEERSRGFYQVVDARSYRVRVADLTRDRRRAEDLLADVKADVYFELLVAGCSARERSKVVEEKQKDGTKVSKTKWWYEAECSVTFDMVDRAGNDLASFEVVGTHETSLREKSQSWERDTSLSAAIDDAARLGASRFTPHRVTESIALEKEAPMGPEGIELVEAGRYDEARRMWERARDQHGDVAALRYNLGAVCEALGDVNAARREYGEAIRLAPGKERYRQALDKLEQRESDAEALRRRR